MNIIVLTTDTLHHAYFVRELSEEGLLHSIVEETTSVSSTFETAHPFEKNRDEHEQMLFFGGKTSSIKEYADVVFVETANDEACMEHVRKTQPDLVIAFGTGKLKIPLISFLQDKLLNLHGGDPQRYRGLDSHYWAIYHREFSALTVCLQKVAAQLDTGDIVIQQAIPLARGLEIHQLRAENTKVCANLALSACDMLNRSGSIPSFSQSTLGRYYSFMPRVLKELCVKRFLNHTKLLSEETP